MVVVGSSASPHDLNTVRQTDEKPGRARASSWGVDNCLLQVHSGQEVD